MRRLAGTWMVMAFLAVPFLAAAAEKAHDMMPGMKKEGMMEGHGGMKMGDHGHRMKMGDKIFGGKVGPWRGEGRLGGKG